MDSVSDDQLAAEMHLLAVLLRKHSGLVSILNRNGGLEWTIESVEDQSAELHPQVVVYAG